MAYKTYTVQKGDTLWGIAQKMLGNGSRYPEIKRINGMTGDTIHPGQILTLPIKVTPDPDIAEVNRIRKAVENCVKMVENSAEFKELAQLMGWK